MTVFWNAARGRWQCDFTRKGKRYQGYADHPDTGAKATGKRQAQAHEGIIKARLAQTAPETPEKRPVAAMTLAEVVADYAEHHGRHTRDWRSQKAHLREVLTFFGEATPVEDITPADIERYTSWCRAQPVRVYVGGPRKGGEWRETGKTREPNTVNGYLTTLRAALNRTFRARKVSGVPPVPGLRGPDDLPNPVRPEDARAIMAVAAPHVRDTVLLCALTGMRLREALRLLWAQVDLARGTLLLDSTTKAGRGRVVYLTPEARALLARLRAEGAGQGNVILYRPAKGAPRPVSSIKTGWKAALRRAGLAGAYRFHDTRGTFCTALADAGADPLAIKALAGHASITTTLRYIKAADARLRETVDRLPPLGTS